MKEVIQGKNEERKDYLLRVAGFFIKEHCLDGKIFYDEAVCDGYCLHDELLTAGGQEAIDEEAEG